MPRRVTLALALASALTGCVAAPPSGPLVEYRDGLTPITRPVKCPATYVLTATDQYRGPVPLAEHHVAKGERIGFKRQEDGSLVAVAPGYTLPLPPGAYTWEVVRASVQPLHERLWCETRERTVQAGKTTLFVVGACCLVVVALAVLYAYAEGESNSNTATATNKK